MKLPSYAISNWQRMFYYGFLVFCGLVLLFLALPGLLVIPISFSSSSFLNYPIPGFSWRWFEKVFFSGFWIRALKNSLIIGSCSMLLATALGTVASIGLARGIFPFKEIITVFIISPMIIPVIISGLGMYLFFTPLGLSNSYLGLILAHAILGAPFVVITVTATLQGFSSNLIRAGLSLGASPAKVFFWVILPLILPGVISGALFAFAISFDEVVVTMFLAGPNQRTLPLQMFDGLRENITPAVCAVATLLVVFAVTLFLVLEWLRRRNEKIRTQTK